MPPNMSYCSTLNVHICMSIEQRNIIDKKSCSLLFLLTSVLQLIFWFIFYPHLQIMLYMYCILGVSLLKVRYHFPLRLRRIIRHYCHWKLWHNLSYFWMNNWFHATVLWDYCRGKRFLFSAITLLEFLHSLKSIHHKSGITW